MYMSLRMISVYLDNCCYNRPYDDQDQLTIRLETDSKVVCSRANYRKQTEISLCICFRIRKFKNPHNSRKEAIFNFFKNASVFVDSSYLEEVTVLAAKIMTTGVKKMDAYQVAAAIIGKADYFLTTDKRLLKY